MWSDVFAADSSSVGGAWCSWKNTHQRIDSASTFTATAMKRWRNRCRSSKVIFHRCIQEACQRPRCIARPVRGALTRRTTRVGSTYACHLRVTCHRDGSHWQRSGSWIRSAERLWNAAPREADGLTQSPNARGYDLAAPKYVRWRTPARGVRPRGSCGSVFIGAVTAPSLLAQTPFARALGTLDSTVTAVRVASVCATVTTARQTKPSALSRRYKVRSLKPS